MGESQANDDFRPVFILAVLSKVYERLSLRQMVDFLTETAALQPNVSAYRKSHSATTTLLAIRDDILKVRVRVRSLLYTPLRGFSVIQDKAIIHYQVYTKKYLPKKKIKLLKFPFLNSYDTIKS